MKILIKLVLIAFLFISCSTDKKPNSNFFNGVNKSEKKIAFNTIALDTVVFDPIESSYNGFFDIYKNEINFIDQRFCWIFTFDKDGKIQSQNLGQGAGPNELDTGFIDAYKRLPNGKHLFMGSVFDVHIHDENWEREKKFVMKWNLTKAGWEINADNLDPDEQRLYSPHYENFKIQTNSNNNVYFTVEANHILFNKYYTKEYYDMSRIFADLDLESGKVKSVFGRKSREYLNYNYLGAYDTFDYVMDSKNQMYVNHPIDSLIYVYNDEHENIYTFGNAGKNMMTNYPEFNSQEIDGIMSIYQNKKPNTSYYTDVKHIEEKDIFFRSYHKPIAEGVDGLQIYKGNVLVADVDVPKGFKVAGYIDPYFYSDAILEEDELTLKAYKFTLPNIE
ncbi:hypothetical protein [Kordia antarctica]|nr:hypothetical protein [Kordia antarctica]